MMKLRLIVGLMIYFLFGCGAFKHVEGNAATIIKLQDRVTRLERFIEKVNFDEKNQEMAQIRNKPDLIVADITYKDPYIYVSYINQGLSKGEGDFLIKVSVSKTEKSFGGNHYYRFKTPKPDEIQKTGGITIGLVGLEKGMEAIITAEIDWEERVFESNETNNIFYKQVRLK